MHIDLVSLLCCSLKTYTWYVNIYLHFMWVTIHLITHLEPAISTHNSYYTPCSFLLSVLAVCKSNVKTQNKIHNRNTKTHNVLRPFTLLVIIRQLFGVWPFVRPCLPGWDLNERSQESCAFAETWLPPLKLACRGASRPGIYGEDSAGASEIF